MVVSIWTGNQGVGSVKLVCKLQLLHWLRKLCSYYEKEVCSDLSCTAGLVVRPISPRASFTLPVPYLFSSWPSWPLSPIACV